MPRRWSSMALKKPLIRKKSGRRKPWMTSKNGAIRGEVSLFIAIHGKSA